MRPKFGLGRLPGITPPGDRDAESEADVAEGTTEMLDAEAEAESATSPLGQLPRPPNSAPTRPDLGPPAPGPQSTNQPGSGLGLVISVAVSAIVFVLAIYATGSPTANPLPLAQTTNALFWAVGVAAVVVAGLGAIYADRTASRGRDRTGSGAFTATSAWIVPVVATASAVILVATFHYTAMIVAGPLIAFLGNAGALLSRDLLDDADDSAQQTAITIHALVIHSVAFLALSAVYLNKLPTTVSALMVGIAMTLLALETLERSPVDQAGRLYLALLTGGTVAAAIVPLMWWPTHGWTGGAVLFVVFYCAVGVLQTGTERRGLRLRDGIEYGLIPLAAFLLLAITA